MARKKKELPLLTGIEITALAAEGKALAKVKMHPDDESEMVVFIPFGAPGDVADIKIDRRKRHFAEGHIERLITPSPRRIDAICPYFGTCGGCKWQHLPYSLQLECKSKVVEDALTRIAKVPIPEIQPILGSENIWHYRNKMEYTFSDKKWRSWSDIRSGKIFDDSGNALGFHIPGAFDKVLHIEQCYLQDSLGDRIREFIFRFAEENSLSFYNLRENHGLLRTMMIRIASTGQVMVCMSFGEDDQESIRLLMQAVEIQFPEITSLLYVVNTKLNDTISDLTVNIWKGTPYIEEKMEGLRFRINAKSFYQTNSSQAYRLYQTARSFAGLDGDIPEQQRPVVYDLYTGTGTIANFVSHNARKVIGIEYVPEAIEDAKLNSRINGICNTEFIAGDMKDILTDSFIRTHGHPDIMIVDPPRAGMHTAVTETILRAAPDIIVYVSCNPATQARDLALLDAEYIVDAVRPVDMFPHTHHVENVVRLIRRPTTETQN